MSKKTTNINSLEKRENKFLKSKNNTKKYFLKLHKQYTKFYKLYASISSDEYEKDSHKQIRRDYYFYRLCKAERSFEIYMLRKYRLDEVLASDIFNEKISIDEALSRFDPRGLQINHIEYPETIRGNEVFFGWRGGAKEFWKNADDRNLQKYYDIQRTKQGWCYLDSIDVGSSLCALAAGILDTFNKKISESINPCMYFVKEYYSRNGQDLSMSFEEFEKCLVDYIEDEDKRKTYEDLTNKISEYQQKSINELVNALREGAEDVSYDRDSKKAKAATNAFKKVLEFYGELLG